MSVAKNRCLNFVFFCLEIWCFQTIALTLSRKNNAHINHFANILFTLYYQIFTVMQEKLLEPYQVIRIKREKLKLNQAQVAEMIYMAEGTYAKIEQGKTDLTVDKLKKLAKALNLTFSEIFGEKDLNGGISNEIGNNFGNQINIVQNSFDNERKAYQTQIEHLQKEVEHLREERKEDRQDLQNTFENERKAYLVQIETLKETVALLQKINR